MSGKGGNLSQRFHFVKIMIFCIFLHIFAYSCPVTCDLIGSLPSECGGINEREGNLYGDHWSGDPVRECWFEL